MFHKSPFSNWIYWATCEVIEAIAYTEVLLTQYLRIHSPDGSTILVSSHLGMYPVVSTQQQWWIQEVVVREGWSLLSPSSSPSLPSLSGFIAGFKGRGMDAGTTDQATTPHLAPNNWIRSGTIQIWSDNCLSLSAESTSMEHDRIGTATCIARQATRWWWRWRW